MTPNAIFIGIASGAASALLYATVTTGGSLVMPLFLAAPLPIAIAGLGWGTFAGLIAAVVAGLGLGLLTVPAAGLLHALVVGVPMALYAHLAGLARPTGPTPADLEWYPLRRVLAVMVVVTAVSLVAVGAIFGFDVPSLADDVAKLLETMAETSNDASLPDHQSLVGMLDVFMRILPFAVAMFWLTIMAVNLALAARIARLSGRFARPQDAIAATVDLSPLMLLLFALAIAVSFAGGSGGLVASTLAGAIAMGYAIVGFAVTHVLVRGSAAAPLILGVAYASTFVLSIPLVLFTLLGIADRPFGIRRRRLARIQPTAGGGNAPPPAS